MNIWYLSAYDQPKGQSSRTYDFCLELVRRGHQVTMFTNSYCHFTHVEYLGSHERWRIEQIDGIRVVWLRTVHYSGNGLRRGLNMLSNMRRSLQAARTLPDEPHVVIGPSVPLGTGWAASRIASLKNAAFVFEVRDVWPAALVDLDGLSKSNPIFIFFALIEKYLYRKACRISSALPFIHQHVSDCGGDPNRVTWIPNGMNILPFANYLSYDGGIGRPLVVMYVGGFGVVHDVLTIVRAAIILQKAGNDSFRFIIVGDGIKKTACQREAAQSKAKYLEFRDPVKKSEVPGVQMQADILIAAVPDSAAFRFGINLNKLGAYFASGRPIVFAGNTPNDPVADAGAGLSVPAQNPEAMVHALQQLLQMSPAERIELGMRGRRYAENALDMRGLADRMERLLSDAVKDN